MWGTRSISLAITLVICWQCLLREAAGTCAMNHPQKKFCDADYVFRFKAMTEAEEEIQTTPDNGIRRSKRLAPGGMWMAKRQMVEVKRFYKGKEIVMPMVEVMSSEDLKDTFIASAKKMAASIRLGLNEHPLKKNEAYVYFGKMFRYRNNTMMPSKEQVMMSRCGNTIPESKLTKVMRRGFRRKYAEGCRSGCQVKTVFTKIDKKSTSYCYWNPFEYTLLKTDCRKTSQFCHKGKDGFCYWKKTKAYRKCFNENRMS